MINPSPLWGFGRGGSGGGGVSEARALGIYELIKSCGIEVRIWERQVAGAPRRAPCDLVDASPHRAGSLNFYHPEMQTALLASAEHSGATVKRAVTVLEVIPGDRPRVRARDDGREQTYSANLVIGADGRNSRCRHWAGFQVDQDPKLMWIAGVLLEGSAAPTDRVCLLINPSAGVWSLIAPLGGSRFRAYVGIFKSQGMKPLSGHQALSDFVNASISAGAPSVWFEHMSPVGPLACFEAADQWIRHPYRNGAATQVPSTHTRSFLVADGVVCIPINDLPCVERPPECYCIIGSGKTGIDACLWLLANKVSPDSIRWIMPRDGWWSNRAKLQWTEDFFETSVSSVADQMEALAEATSVDDLFARFEACGASYRLDPDITPTMFHGATISASELNALRQIKDIVRMGRVKSIQREAIILERGELASRDDCLYVDCSATGIPLRPNVPVFNDRRITLQFVRAFRPCLSAAAIAFIEAHFADDAEKNTLCAPVPPVTAGLGWVRIVSISMANHARWSNHPELMRWLASSRLDGGVHGDHWVKGCWKSTEGGKPHPDVQICIMNARCIQLIAQERPNWPPAGDNLFIDMDLSPDNTPPGTRLGIGTAVIEITAIPHNGCASFAARYGVMRRSS